MMNDDHLSALELIQELRKMGATEIAVDDVVASFPPAASAEVLPPAVAEELIALRAENEALRIYKEQTEAD